ncbi:DUF3303 domain-containing protein [Planctomycetota bacterium]
MYYMVIATFKDDVLSELHEYAKGDDISKLRKFAEDHHAKVPDGLEYVDGWLDVNGRRVFELIKSSNENLIKQWAMQLSDLFECEIDHVVPVPSPGKKNC